MIQHIGLSIEEVTEIHNFYENVLGFQKTKQFSIDSTLAGKIFGFKESPEVFFLKRDETELEIFLGNQKANPAWNHICISLPNANQTIEAGEEAGYEVITHQGQKSTTWFLRDKAGNLFEIKEAKT